MQSVNLNTVYFHFAYHNYGTFSIPVMECGKIFPRSKLMGNRIHTPPHFLAQIAFFCHHTYRMTIQCIATKPIQPSQLCINNVTIQPSKLNEFPVRSFSLRLLSMQLCTFDNSLQLKSHFFSTQNRFIIQIYFKIAFKIHEMCHIFNSRTNNSAEVRIMYSYYLVYYLVLNSTELSNWKSSTLKDC